MCREAFNYECVIPDPREDAAGWFDLIDWDHSGTLEPEEVTDGLKATVALDFRRVEADIIELWPMWDVNNDGIISFEEFRNGLLPYIIENYPGNEPPPPYSVDDESSNAFEFDMTRARARGEIPDIHEKPRLWFSYWDEDASGTLSRPEVLRAIIKTFQIRDNNARTLHIASMLDAIWGLFDHDGSGEIDVSEFTATEGLCDTILASIVHERV